MVPRAAPTKWPIFMMHNRVVSVPSGLFAQAWSPVRPRALFLWVVTLLSWATFCPALAADYFELAAWDGGCVLPDDVGQFETVVIHYEPEVREELAVAYRDLFKVLPADITVQVVCPSRKAAREFMRQWEPAASAGGRKVQVINANQPVTLWARDRRIARYDKRTGLPATNCVPTDPSDYENEKRNEIRVFFSLAQAHLGPFMSPTTLFIEGGNVVSNRRHVFVGGNVLEENSDLLEADSGMVHRELRRIIGRKYHLIHGDEDGLVPWCHVDMYLTPLDEETVLVADPSLGTDALCDDDLPDDDRREALADLLSMMDDSPECQARFDAVADQMHKLGYRVLRMPAIVDQAEDWMVTYNNVLIERRGDRKIVYMPTYEIPVLDQLAARVYRDLGCQVRTIDVSKVYEYGGAVRCMVNVVSRKMPEPAGTQVVRHPKNIVQTQPAERLTLENVPSVGSGDGTALPAGQNSGSEGVTRQ